MSDDQTVTALRHATAAAVRDHHLPPDVAAAAWSAARAPRRRLHQPLAIAAGVAGALAVATALTVWGNSEHANPPAGGSVCERNVSSAALPSWARAGFTPSGMHIPHVISEHGQIIGVLFVTLRVHQPVGTRNKILWVARDPGYGPLRIRAQLEGSSRTVTRDLPEGPGPSYVDMPAAGCWQMHVTWSGHHDTIAFRYAP